MNQKIASHELIFAVINEQNFAAVQEIYAQGLATKNATFETSVPDWKKWNQSHTQHSCFVAIYQNRIIGWGALSPVSDRCVYEGVAELSVYIHQDYKQHNVGTLILKQLILESEKNGIHSLMSGIFPENEASIQMHVKQGFRIVGRRERIAQLDGVWRDTILLQRRSINVGV